MQKFKKIISSMLISSFLAISAISTAQAADTIRDEMMFMARYLMQANKAEDAVSFEQSIDKFIDASIKSQEITPKKFEGKTEDIAGYKDGMQKVIDLANEAKALAKQGQLDEAKAKLQGMTELRKTYHKLYK